MNNASFTKEEVAQAVVKQIKNVNKEILVETALLKTCSNPDQVIWKSNKTGYIPDIKAVTQEGNINIYEIELQEEFNVNKWELFSMFTKKNNGELVLVIPESRVKEVNRKIKNANLENIYLLSLQS